MSLLQPKKTQFKRSFRRRRRQVEGLTQEAGRQLDKHIFNPISKEDTQIAWRFIGSWLTLILILLLGVGVQARALGRYYTTTSFVPGGEFVEGVNGSFTNANPVFATSPVDLALSRLMFSGLLRYDRNGNLTGDLAESWTVDGSGTNYTFKLRKGLRWHDGLPVSADDVVFTIQALQNPDTRSPYNLSWQGVSVKAEDAYTVTISLPGPLSSFLYSMTQGIVPKHRLKDLEYSEWRSADFNNKTPVGTGPFVWQSLTNLPEDGDRSRQRVRLKAYADYHFGEPKLDRYTIETFSSNKQIIDSLATGAINGATLSDADEISDQLAGRLTQYNVPLMGGVYLFFNNDNAPLDDVNVRSGLERAINTDEVRKTLGYPVVSVNSPLLRIHFAYDASRAEYPYNEAEAGSFFDKAGFTKAANSFIRSKDQKALEFTLLTEDVSEYRRLADNIQKQLAKVGVKLTVDLRSGRDFQQALVSHQYDALLYGISIGGDPDVYAFWHSSQAAADRYNFSNYKSTAADASLESGRSREDKQLRTVKYRSFLDSWRSDAPAVGLYQPRLLFVTNGNLSNFSPKVLSDPSDRYQDVHLWMINTDKTLLR